MNADHVWGRLGLVRTLSFVAQSTKPGGWNGEGAGAVVVESCVDGTMTFTESGLWTPTGGREIRFWNVYRWTRSESGLRLEHLRFGVGHPVYLFDLAPVDEQRWASVTPHLCSEDCYTARMTIGSDGIDLEWSVNGPTKVERIHYTYTASA